MNIIKKLPVNCPSCNNTLQVVQLGCKVCATHVSGNYSLPLLMQLTQEEQDFILSFLLCSGSLKEMAIQMGNSYPTVRNKLDDIILKINQLKKNEQ